MSTPPNKRDQRRGARQTQIAKSQSSTQNRPQVGKTTGQSKTPTTPTLSTKSTSAKPTGSQVKSSARPEGVVTNAPADEAATTPPPQTKRDQRRLARQEQLARVQAEQRRHIQQAKQRELIQRVATGVIVALVVILLSVWLWNFIHAPASKSPTQSGIVVGTMMPDGYGSQIKCDSSEGSASQYHTALEIYINGSLQTIPADIGIQNNCLTWLHTHDTTSIVYIESPVANAKYLLGDWFAVWGKYPSPTQGALTPDITHKTFFGQPIDAEHQVTVYVNGKQFNGDYNTLVLYDHETIYLEYGTPLVPYKAFDFAKYGV
jgi:hypothetical protein